jgi:hypothetical protein
LTHQKSAIISRQSSIKLWLGGFRSRRAATGHRLFVATATQTATMKSILVFITVLFPILPTASHAAEAARGGLVMVEAEATPGISGWVVDPQLCAKERGAKAG